jgi:hypothetical protein
MIAFKYFMLILLELAAVPIIYIRAFFIFIDVILDHIFINIAGLIEEAIYFYYLEWPYYTDKQRFCIIIIILITLISICLK